MSSKNEKKEFDLFIWAGLLDYVNKTGNLPTRTKISNMYAISDRVAYAYQFALKSRTSITSDFDLTRKLGKVSNEVRDLRRTNAKLETENQLLEAKVDFLLALDISENLTSIKKITKSVASVASNESTVISLFSDSHVEERIDPYVINGLNENTPELAKRKIELFFKRTLWMIESWRKGGWNIKNLILALLGDIINSYIHEEFIEDNFKSPTEAVIFVQEILIAGIKFLVEHGNFDKLTIVCKYGNHGRTSKRKKYSTGYKNSYEWMMYTQIKKIFDQHLRYDNVEFIIEKGEFTRIEVYDKILCFSHGDHFRYQGGIGGVLVPFNRWIHKMESILAADKYYIAHWHSRERLSQGVINGSIIGYNSFAMGHAFKPEPPLQHMELIDSKRGFSIDAPIILTDWV